MFPLGFVGAGRGAAAGPRPFRALGGFAPKPERSDATLDATRFGRSPDLAPVGLLCAALSALSLLRAPARRGPAGVRAARRGASLRAGAASFEQAVSAARWGPAGRSWGVSADRRDALNTGTLGSARQKLEEDWHNAPGNVQQRSRYKKTLEKVFRYCYELEYGERQPTSMSEVLSEVRGSLDGACEAIDEACAQGLFSEATVPLRKEQLCRAVMRSCIACGLLDGRVAEDSDRRACEIIQYYPEDGALQSPGWCRTAREVFQSFRLPGVSRGRSSGEEKVPSP